MTHLNDRNLAIQNAQKERERAASTGKTSLLPSYCRNQTAYLFWCIDLNFSLHDLLLFLHILLLTSLLFSFLFSPFNLYFLFSSQLWQSPLRPPHPPLRAIAAPPTHVTHYPLLLYPHRVPWVPYPLVSPHHLPTLLWLHRHRLKHQHLPLLMFLYLQHRFNPLPLSTIPTHLSQVRLQASNWLTANCWHIIPVETPNNLILVLSFD